MIKRIWTFIRKLKMPDKQRLFQLSLVIAFFLLSIQDYRHQIEAWALDLGHRLQQKQDHPTIRILDSNRYFPADINKLQKAGLLEKALNTQTSLLIVQYEHDASDPWQSAAALDRLATENPANRLVPELKRLEREIDSSYPVFKALEQGKALLAVPPENLGSRNGTQAETLEQSDFELFLNRIQSFFLGQALLPARPGSLPGALDIAPMRICQHIPCPARELLYPGTEKVIASLALSAYLELNGENLQSPLSPATLKAGGKDLNVSANGLAIPLSTYRIPVVENLQANSSKTVYFIAPLNKNIFSDAYYEASLMAALAEGKTAKLHSWAVIAGILLAMLLTWWYGRSPAWLGGLGGWAFAITGSSLLYVVALLLVYWQGTWIEPVLPMIYWLALQTGTSLAHSKNAWLGNQALMNCRHELASELIRYQDYDGALTHLKKAGFSPKVHKSLEQLVAIARARGDEKLATRTLTHIRKLRPGYVDRINASKDKKHQLEENASESKPGLASLLSRKKTANTGNSDQQINRYEIIAEIGRGAMATVYKARDPKINREVALKMLPLTINPDPKIKEMQNRFFREAQAAGRLKHPNIVSVYDVGEDDQQAWIAMDFLSGDDMGRYIKERLDIKTLCRVLAQVADALDYAHQQKVIHRDIKPANIIYHPKTGHVTVTDFGVASLQDAGQTRTGTLLGSPSYMSPEQVKGNSVDGRADIYSLGVTLYQLATGHLPFTGDSLSNVMYKITRTNAPDPQTLVPDLPDEVAEIIHKAMQKSPAKRYTIAADMAVDLLKASM